MPNYRRLVKPQLQIRLTARINESEFILNKALFLLKVREMTFKGRFTGA
jgi:hypothetical protein